MISNLVAEEKMIKSFFKKSIQKKSEEKEKERAGNTNSPDLNPYT